MEKFNEAEIVAFFAACENEKDLRECVTRLCEEDPVVAESSRRTDYFSKTRTARRKQLWEAELAPFHSEAKRMRHGQKVYFGKRCNTMAISLHSLKSVKSREKDFEAGDWAYVWQYQPRKKLLWLCRAKEKCVYGAVVRSPFSLRDLKDYKISRTELKCRK